jgi:putative acetyltransferase
MTIVITAERPDTPDALQLIDELENTLDPLYPSESRHGYGVDKLLREGVAFFVLREDGAAVACGGVQFFNGKHGEASYAELKRMYVRLQYRRRGHAKRILEYLAEHARQRGVTVLRLETGIHQHEAIGLYERWGFVRIPPFGPYTDDPLSVYFEKRLAD